MESPNNFESDEHRGITRRIAGGFIAVIRFVGHQLANSDQNPHEGRLRASGMPTGHMDIPDHPPVHDDNI